jgi:tryptophan synthase alpha chain
MSRIAEKFEFLSSSGRKALIPFVTAGDPNLDMTLDIMHTLVSAGSDIIELGVPFSDPMADGPTIQRSSERALARGTGLKDVLNVVSKFRNSDQSTPIVLMGYANPIEAMGVQIFAEKAQKAGVDGVLVVDYPPEEGDELLSALQEKSIDAIYLLAPTTTDQRIQVVSKCAGGYVYYVSLKGVTGAAHLDLSAIAEKIPSIKKHVKIPVGVGFGIRDGETARAVADLSDAVVIGSRLVEEIEKSDKDNVLKNVSTLIESIRVKLDS